LQDRIAALLGKEAAVFLPSGTMCNQIALLVHCRAGDEVIAADMAHIFTSEAGGGSALAGAQTWPLATKRGIFTVRGRDGAARSERAPRPALTSCGCRTNRQSWWRLRVAAPCIEDVARIAHRHGLAMHMDGARILNAVVASGVGADRMAGPCDSVWVDLSKGLGCPSAGCWQGRKRSSTRLGNGSTGSVVPCANQACWLPLAFTPWITTSSVWRRTMATLAGSGDARQLAGHPDHEPEIETNIVFIDPSAAGMGPRTSLPGCSSTACAWADPTAACSELLRTSTSRQGDMEVAAEAFAQALRRRGR